MSGDGQISSSGGIRELGVGEISLGIISIYGMEIIWHLMEKSWC
jgi:hypothetical protein